MTSLVSTTMLLAAAGRQLSMPLTGLLASLDQLGQTGLSEQQATHARHALTSGRRLQRQLDTIVDFARIEAGMLPKLETDLDPVRLVENVANSVVERLQARGLAIAIIVHPGVPRQLRGDVDCLRRVLSIFVENALDAVSEGGVLLRVKSETSIDGRSQLRFEIEDSGPGVPIALREHIFQPLIGRPDLPWQSAGGLGVSLALARQLAAHAGAQVEYRPGATGGSVFALTLELEPATLPGSSTGMPIPVEENRRILLVESNSFRGRCFLEECRLWALDGRLVADGNDWREALVGGWLPDLMLVHMSAAGASIALAESSDLRVLALVEPGEALRAGTDLVDRHIESMATPVHRDVWIAVLGDTSEPHAQDQTPQAQASVHPEAVAKSTVIDSSGSRPCGPAIGMPPALDRLVMQSLRSELGEAFEDVLLHFGDELRRRMARVDSCAELKAMDGVRREVHALKSAALTFGGRSFGRIAEQLEAAIASGAQEQINGLLCLLRAGAAQLQLELQQSGAAI